MQEDSELELFYHYCSNETFLNIFNTQTFRLNDCLTTNDSKEMKIFVDKFEDFLLEEYQKEKFKIFADAAIHKEKKLWADEAVKFYFQQWKNLVLNSVALFLLCFTTKNDDLSQWHMYADNAYGFNIGLAGSCFEDLCKRSKKGFEFIKVEYITAKAIADIQKQLATELCEDLKKLFAKAQELEAPNRAKYTNLTKFNLDRKNFISARREIRKKAYDIFNKLLFKGILYKDKAFSHEEEWRLVYNPNNNKEEPMPIKYYTKDRIIRKYIELPFADIEMDFFVEIKLGPKNPNTRYSIENFFGTITDFDIVEISESRIPFV